MKPINQFVKNVRVELIAVDATRVGSWWGSKTLGGHRDLNSPYSRLYLITGGQGYITHHNNKFKLSPGTLHLVPRFLTSAVIC